MLKEKLNPLTSKPAQRVIDQLVPGQPVQLEYATDTSSAANKLHKQGWIECELDGTRKLWMPSEKLLQLLELLN